MKALSIRQPYASLLIAGVKHCETRDWITRYRGKLAIHAAKGYDPADRAMAEQLRVWPEARAVIDAGLPLGVMLGIWDLQKIWRTHEVSPQLSALELALGNYQPGRYAWYGVVVDRFDPPVSDVKGKLGLWEWSQS